MNRSNLGRFTIPVEWINDNPSLCLRVLEGIVVTRAEAMFHSDSIEYIGISNKFESIPHGTIAPWYDLVLDSNWQPRFEKVSA